MTYHCRIKKGDGTYHYFWNGPLNWYKEKILIPLLNGQIVVLTMEGEDMIINMRSILEVQLYKTKEKLIVSVDKQSISKIIEEKSFNQYNCTNEILNEVRLELMTNQSKSL